METKFVLVSLNYKYVSNKYSLKCVKMCQKGMYACVCVREMDKLTTQSMMHNGRVSKEIDLVERAWANHLKYMSSAAAKSLQSCPTLCDPIDGSPPGSTVPGFSRQEHWSGLPFPSPMHKSEKWKWSRSVVSDSTRPHGLQPTRLLCP